MIRRLSFLLFLICLFTGLWTVTPARADQSISMVRVLCMPEKGIEHFSLEVQTYTELANYIYWFDKPKLKEDRLAVLEDHGLLYPYEKFEYTCSLPKHKYTISGYKPPHLAQGMCGGDPRVTISIKRDDVTVVENVFLEQACLKYNLTKTNIFVKSISFDDNGLPLATISDGEKQKILNISNLKLTQDFFGCLAGKEFFETGIPREKIESCNQK